MTEINEKKLLEIGKKFGDELKNLLGIPLDVKLTPDQKTALTRLTETALLSAIGNLPGYSNRKNYHVSPVTTFALGSFMVPYYIDETQRNSDTGRMGVPMVFMQIRGAKLTIGEGIYGPFGGFTNVDDNPEKSSVREQPKDGAIREIGEELRNNKGNSIIQPKASRLKHIIEGNDFRFDPPISYNGYALKLTKKEVQTLQAHVNNMNNDPKYKQDAINASGEELADVMCKPLSEVIKMGKKTFTHPHEFEAMENLQTLLDLKSRANGILGK